MDGDKKRRVNVPLHRLDWAGDEIPRWFSRD